MATDFEEAVERFVAACPYVVALHDLVTKVRLEMTSDYVMDLYHNDTLAKYSYTLVKAEARLLGWDNARHHPQIANFPHHVHRIDGSIEPSALNGDPQHDLELVRLEIERFLADHL
jgi:hypothetical protein